MFADLWYRNSVFYNLDLETFQDSNGDGVGDFEGLSRRLDYLESLGINALWLGPFQPTPNRDNGYDISDYYGVDPRHGSSGDFVEFLNDARSRGIRVVIDLVVNHTSDRHPWFREARRSTSSQFHDWYVWSKKRPPNWKSGMVFPGVQERTWTYAKEVQKYYFHRFYDFQPDLNMEHPAVREEVRRIMGFWLALGVAGFRLDAVPFIIEKPSAGRGAQPLRFEYLADMRRFVQWRVGDAALLGEANVAPEESHRYLSESGRLHLMFNFWVNQHVFYALASADVRPLGKALRATRRLPATAQWAQFLRNHDELDLGRLTKEQRAAVFERFGPEKLMQLYDRGIRRRLAPMLGERQRLELAYSLMFSLPGTPVLYYGDEIGMGDDLTLPERHPVRTPMQWSSDHNAGFSTADKLVAPVVATGSYRYRRASTRRRSPRSRSTAGFSARICVSPAACLTSWPAITSGRPALSRKTIASTKSGSKPLPSITSSIRGRYAAVLLALAVTPPGLFAKSAWLSPNAAARSYAERRRSSNANGSGPTISLGRASACGSSSSAVTDSTATTAPAIAATTATTSTVRRRRALDRVGVRERAAIMALWSSAAREYGMRRRQTFQSAQQPLSLHEEQTRTAPSHYSRCLAPFVSDPCQITPTNADQRCLDAEARIACPLAFDHPRPTETTVRPNLQAGGRRFEPGTLHRQEWLDQAVCRGRARDRIAPSPR
jgi:maltose alpha-D-glucosyltransferase / alpha-amylase